MKYVFGPVNSRRFGVSLGVDLSPDQKCCNFDCLYCELSKAKVVNKIQNPPTVAEVVADVQKALEEFSNIDVITITANGEPTLYPNLRELIAEINKIKTTQKTLILSNGTGVLKSGVSESLLELDMVKFSLDSAIQKTYRKIDRGLENFSVKTLIEKMAQFRKIYTGELIMEVLVLEGFNDSDDEFRALNMALEKIKPERIDISSIDRPPAHNANGVSVNRLFELAKLITAVPASVATRKNLDVKFELKKDDILKLLSLRPQSKNDVEHSFSQSSKSVINSLLNSGEIEMIDLAGMKFYKIK